MYQPDIYYMNFTSIIQTVDNFRNLVVLETGRYIRYLWQTWTNLFMTTLFGGLGLFDWVSGSHHLFVVPGLTMI